MVGISGKILINNFADRVNRYNIWDYAEGHDAYRSSMLVDLTEPTDKVSSSLYIRLTEHLCVGVI